MRHKVKQNSSIVKNLDRWRTTLKFHYTGLNESVVPIKYCYNPETDIIVLEFSAGKGATERTEKIVFKTEVINEKLALFEGIEIKKRITQIPMEEERKDNNLKELRVLLFDAIRNLKSQKITTDEAKTMSLVAQTIINSAKLEMEYKMLSKEDREVKFLD